MNKHQLQCDILVAGGGPAGVPCALAAARHGARVILCQDRSVLGGNASSEVRMHIAGADASGHRGAALSVEAREGGIIEEIRLEASVRNPQRSASILDLILYDKCRTEPHLTLMLNTAVVGVERHDDGRIARARAVRQSTEDEFHIDAKIFIDCTGDGRLGAEAGALFRRGREGKIEHGESLAQDEADDKALGSTILFTARKHDRPMPFVAPAWARKFDDTLLKHRPHAISREDNGLGFGYWWCEWGGTLDTIKDNETIRDELLAIVLGVWDHVKNHEGHNAEHWALEWIGFLPGKRESRRFIGQCILTEQDVLESRPQPDAIAYGGWPIDTHPPEGVDAANEPACRQHHVPHLFDIPLRACVSRNVPNLMFAGRNISATHIAFASTRVMATCAVIGQGVGTAAASAVAHGIQPSELSANSAAIKRIQQRLLRDDVFLIGAVNDDGADLARSATVTASSQQADGAAVNVLSGQTRAVHGSGGVKPDRARPGTHRWMSDPTTGLPAWLELRWPHPIRPREVRLVFDTGLHRVLTQTQCDAYAARMQWGRPQQETVRDYRIMRRDPAGRWATCHEVTGNYQRLCVHPLDAPVELDTLRIEITATQGIDHARVVEVRVY